MASSYLEPVSKRRRAIAIALTVLVHLLVVWLLLNLSPKQPDRPSFGDALATFDVASDAASDRPRAAAVRPSASKPVPPKPPPPPTPVIPVKRDLMHMTKDEFAATDISGLAHSAEPSDDAGTASAGAGDSVAVYGPGAGPGGRQLFNAEWYREPTNAELSFYLPPAPPDSWGEIACKTIPDFHVDSCQTLGENPRGSGLATGMRRAAWQFRVRPPRIGSKPVIGAWVRIRIEFTLRGAEVVGARR